MIARGLAVLVVGAGVGLGVGAACRVPNEDHCANQDRPGDRWCRETYPTAPYCSPCIRDLSGCVRFPPYACEGYAPDDDTDGSTTGDLEPSTGSESSAETGNG